MSSKDFSPAIEKLKGRENFSDWEFAVEAYFQHEDLWKFVDSGSESATADVNEKDAKGATRARAKLIFLVEPINYVHIRGAKTAAEMWKKLKCAFEDSGLTRRVGLLRQLISTNMKDCDSVESYVNSIVNTAHKLRGVGMDVSDEWVGTLLLAGLSDEYRPMIMGIESSGVKVTADSIKTKLLQDVKSLSTEEYETALAARTFEKKRKSFDRSKVRCYNCNEFGHISRECKSNVKEETVLLSSFATYSAIDRNDWYIDSGASGHMTMRKDFLCDTTKPSECEVIVANNSRLHVELMGDVRLTVRRGNEDASVRIKNVRYIPNICANLLSVSQMARQGITVMFDESGCRMIDANNRLVATASIHNNMYRLDRPVIKCFSAFEAEPAHLMSRRYDVADVKPASSKRNENVALRVNRNVTFAMSHVPAQHVEHQYALHVTEAKPLAPKHNIFHRFALRVDRTMVPKAMPHVPMQKKKNNRVVVIDNEPVFIENRKKEAKSISNYYFVDSECDETSSVCDTSDDEYEEEDSGEYDDYDLFVAGKSILEDE